jgi:hypothetical protein
MNEYMHMKNNSFYFVKDRENTHTQPLQNKMKQKPKKDF